MKSTARTEAVVPLTILTPPILAAQAEGVAGAVSVAAARAAAPVPARRLPEERGQLPGLHRAVRRRQHRALQLAGLAVPRPGPARADGTGHR